MFHTLFDLNNIIYQKKNNNNIKNQFNFSGENDYYFGKGNIAIDQYNRKKKKMENDANFEKTKNKIKLVVYKNGFIMNDEPFRDKSIYENYEFLEEVEKGNIPQELIRKGISDLGILLINRKTETYQSPLYQSLPSSFNALNISQKSVQSKYLEQNLISERSYQNTKDLPKYNSTFVPQTPMQTRQRNNIYFNNDTYKVQNEHIENKNNKRTNSLPKDKKIITLSDIIKNSNEREKKQFTAFSGSGLLLGSANIDGIFVDEISNTNGFLNTNSWIPSTSQFNNGIKYDGF